MKKSLGKCEREGTHTLGRNDRNKKNNKDTLPLIKD